MVHLTVTGLVTLLSISGPAAAVAAPPPFRATTLDSSICVGNNHVYRSGLSYNVKGSNYIVNCAKDSTGAAIFSQEIPRGDFASCFKICERTKGCDGFTFVGDRTGGKDSGKDSGKCYFKSDVGESLPASDDVITCKKDYDGPRGLEPELDPSGLPTHGLGHNTKSSHESHSGHWTRSEGGLESRAADVNEQDLEPTKTHTHHPKSKHKTLATKTTALPTGLRETELPMMNSSPQWCRDWVHYQDLQFLKVLVEYGNADWDQQWLADPPRDDRNHPAQLTTNKSEAVTIFIHPENKGLVSFHPDKDNCSLRYFHMVPGTHECIWSELEPEYLVGEGEFEQNSYLEPYLVVVGRKDWGDWVACDFGEGYLRIKYFDKWTEWESISKEYVCAMLMLRLDDRHYPGWSDVFN